MRALYVLKPLSFLLWGLILFSQCTTHDEPTAPENSPTEQTEASLQKGGGNCVPAPSDLVSWWPGDGDANDIQDSNPGTPVGGTTFAQGLVGQAFSFDGSLATGVFIGDKANLESLPQITVDAWVKTTDPSGNRAIVSKHRSTNTSWVLRTFFGDNTGRVSFGVETNLGTTVTLNELVSTTSISDGQFHHVAGTYDGSTVKLYVDGVLENSAPLSGTIKNSVYDVVIGNFHQASFPVPNASFNGLIDEVEVYNRALTASEIQAIFNAGSAGKCKLTVDIDIKPGSDPNSINPNSKGVISVAILTTDDFDATSVDPLSVEFGLNGATESHGKGHIEDADGDGDLDMVLHFRTQETGIQCGDTNATLTGITFGGQTITGTDAIQTVGCN